VKEAELRLYAKCSMCEKPIGNTGMPVFSRVTVERIGIIMKSVRRQDGLAVMLESAGLAAVMGADEEMTTRIGGTVTLSICERCYLDPVMVARLAELPDVLAKKESF
jgi:hypothetical protein